MHDEARAKKTEQNRLRRAQTKAKVERGDARAIARRRAECDRRNERARERILERRAGAAVGERNQGD